MTAKLRCWHVLGNVVVDPIDGDATKDRRIERRQRTRVEDDSIMVKDQRMSMRFQIAVCIEVRVHRAHVSYTCNDTQLLCVSAHDDVEHGPQLPLQ